MVENSSAAAGNDSDSGHCCSGGTFKIADGRAATTAIARAAPNSHSSKTKCGLDYTPCGNITHHLNHLAAGAGALTANKRAGPSYFIRGTITRVVGDDLWFHGIFSMPNPMTDFCITVHEDNLSAIAMAESLKFTL